MKYVICFTISIFFVINLKADGITGPIPVTATEANPVGGGYSRALLYFEYKGNDYQLRKPLIVFEGYDPGYYTKPKEKEGRTGIRNFIRDIENQQTGAASSDLLPLPPHRCVSHATESFQP